MGLTIDREAGNYEVFDLFLEHNHMLQLPQTAHLMPSQRKISEVQAFEIEIADDSGIGPKAAHELASRRVGGSHNVGYTRRDHKNYLRTRRQRELMYGEAGSMLKYFQDRTAENPSFQYALQLDCEEQITNVFWADAKMIIDYAHFGDVVTFDTTFGTNKEHRPIGVSTGFNHFRETVIFGACLMYDETCDSFKWLFDTFLSVHNQKQPRTIYTDQDIAMGKAIELLFPEAWHGLCTFHIMQNAVKHLSNHSNKESNLLADFSACMYEYEDKVTFEEAFEATRAKVQKQTWFDSIYRVREKWAECYMRDVFTLGMRSTQLSESLNSDLKHYLKSDLNIIRFFKHFERAVQGKRDNELNSEYESRKKLPRIKMRTPMLVQASKVYTPAIFECFQIEYERSTAACTKLLGGSYTYAVTIGFFSEHLKFEDECKVIGNPLEQTASCSCGQFERIGILCAHALKVLDLMNIKLLPTHYILRRWTREARSGTIQDRHGRNVEENPMLDAALRYKFLSYKFVNLASQASSSEECCILIENALDSLSKQVQSRMEGCQSNSSEGPDSQVIPDVSKEDLSAARLKKKPAQKRRTKRERTWLDRQHKTRNKGPATVSTV
ncbi:hypothetical protein ACP70R_039513 [Stipagrostis hirtigluma subsp. patula]